ncbi:hypothetical protein ET532_029215, partial [Verminephrobacter sp. Larva24]
AALRAGKHVFVEKPLSLDVATCEALAALAAAHPAQVVMVGFERRFDPDLVRARAAIERGELGRPFLVRSQTCDRIDPDGFFVKFAPTSGGIFNDCSVHDIDLARWMLGNPKATKVFASGTNAQRRPARRPAARTPGGPCRRSLAARAAARRGAAVSLLGADLQRPPHPLRPSLCERGRRLPRPDRAWPADRHAAAGPAAPRDARGPARRLRVQGRAAGVRPEPAAPERP